MSNPSRLRTLQLSALAIAASLFAAACARPCITDFERDARYVAVRAYDPAVYRSMHTAASAVQQRGSACRAELEAKVRPMLNPVLKRALEEAPDSALVLFMKGEVRRAKALASADPESCVEILVNKATTRARAGWSRLSQSERDASEDAEARLLEAARATGKRSPPFTDEESSKQPDRFQTFRRTPESAFVFNGNATPSQQCSGYVALLEAFLALPEPARARSLRRFMGGPSLGGSLTPLNASEEPPSQLPEDM